MEIIGGTACGLALVSPHTDDVRPTSVRARKAFFDSLGDLTGMVFADLCAGSGAMGLEAASRGAEQVIFVERSPESLRTIAVNCDRIRHTGVETELTVIRGALPGAASLLKGLPRPDLLFADPPYAVSAQLLDDLTKNPVFTEWASGGRLFWELPEGGTALRPPVLPWTICAIRSLGPARFMVLETKKS